MGRQLKTQWHVPVIDRDQEAAELWSRYTRFKESDIRELLLKKYSYLVRLVLGRMKVTLVPHLDHDDLESAGVISLIQSLDRFDPSRGIKFETFAYRRIQGGILDHLRQIDYLSRTSRERIKHLRKAFEKLKEILGRSPTDEELISDMKISAEELKKTYFDMSCEAPISLEAAANTDDDSDLPRNAGIEKDTREIEVLDQLVQKENVDYLAEAISQLPEREKILVSLYYYEHLTFKEIGTIFHVSESRVCQMHSKAMMEIGERFQDRRSQFLEG